MKTAQELYDTYRIMPGLQMHQLRVAAVAKTLCENVTRDVDEQSVVLACLFHDMGNIIKSDLTFFPEFLEPDGVAHWQFIKNDFVAKFGTDEHYATDRIVQEIGLAHAARSLIDGVGFSKLVVTRDSGSFEQKIVEYADLRVGPHGVLPMGARIEEAKTRYAGKHPDIPRDEETFEKLAAAAYGIEQQVFSEATISPDDITEHAVQALFTELREYKVA